MNNPIVKVEHLSAAYESKSILNDLSFSIQNGEIIAIIGPNGSGKTTLIKAILGLVPYQGEISINQGPVLKSLNRIGYVPQRFDWDRTIPMTVEEFLKIPFERMPRERILHALKEVDMTSSGNAQVGSLSGGQFRRILIARALVNDPFLLILDEATSGIDVAGAKSFYEILSHLNQVHKTTVILVSHEINMVYQFANRVICLNRDLICCGKPREAITREVLEKLYGKEFRFQEHKH